MAIEWKETPKSSMFSKVGYDEGEWVLGVEYRSNGLRLAAQNFPPEMYDEMMAAESIGKFFNANVKGKFEMIGDDAAPPVVEKKKVQEPECGLTEEELNFIAPPPAEEGVQAEVAVLEPTTWPDYGGIDRGQSMILSPQPEVLPAWTKPTNAVEAIVQLNQHESEIVALIKANTEYAAEILSIVVRDAATYEAAGEKLKLVVDREDKTFDLLDPFRKILYDTYTAAGARQKEAITPISQAVSHLKKIMLAYSQEQERIRQAAIRAERERAEAEARRKQEEASQQLTLMELQDAVDSGDTQKAEELLQRPIEAPRPMAQPVYIPPATTKTEGVSTTKKYKVDEDAIGTDETYHASIMTLLRAVSSGKYDISLAAKHLQWDMKALNKLAEGMQSAFNVPGLSVREVENMRVRRGK